ncbi:MAG: hypothetical protein QG585_517 [Patescibacteria group bacterium]|nr:hypothetical protein [Patescibacteria group bacterium]
MFLKEKINWFNKLSECCLYVFLVTFPFLNYTSFLYFGSVTRSINLILISSILGLFLGLLLLNKESSFCVSRSPILISLFVYFVSIFTSAFFSNDFQASFFSNMTRTTGLWYMICFGIFLAVLVNLLQDKKVRRKIILAIIAPTALFSILSLLGPEGFKLIFKEMKGDGFTFGNSTFAGMYIFGSFLLSIYFLLSEEKKSFWKKILPVLIVLNPFFINIFSNEGKGVLQFLGEARASSVALLGSIGALGLSYLISKIKDRSIKKKISYGLFAVTFVGIVLGAFSLFSEDGALRKFYLSQSTSARILVWEISDKLIREKPLLGWGTENFEKTFELNYDSRALQKEFGAEPWFDRAHNVFIDQAFDNGLVGLALYLLVYVILGLSMLYVIFNSKQRDNQLLATILLVYTIFHLIELQTAFDTSISFGMVAVMLALAVVILKETHEENGKAFEMRVPKILKYVFAVALLVFSFWSLFYKTIPFLSSGIANGKVRTVGSSEKRIPYYETLFATPVDLQAVLWRTFTDFERGISENPKVLEDPKKVENLKKELAIFEEEYRKYTEKNPTNFRALLNYADTKIYFMLFGVNKLEEAQVVLDKAIELVPTAPQPYWMKSVAYLYMQKFDLAREYAKKGLELNPNVPGSQEIVRYIEASIKTFPEIDLYFFRQI